MSDFPKLNVDERPIDWRSRFLKANGHYPHVNRYLDNGFFAVGLDTAPILPRCLKWLQQNVTHFMMIEGMSVTSFIFTSETDMVAFMLANYDDETCRLWQLKQQAHQS